MGILSSKVSKIENNIDIRLHQIYLPKFHENILKILLLKFIQRNQLRPVENFRIS